MYVYKDMYVLERKGMALSISLDGQALALSSVHIVPDYQSSRSVWTMISEIRFKFWMILCVQELDSIIHVGPFQLRIFCYSMIQ